jgi:hypothetical protein
MAPSSLYLAFVRIVELLRRLYALSFIELNSRRVYVTGSLPTRQETGRSDKLAT